jgi:hypothetical protein
MAWLSSLTGYFDTSGTQEESRPLVVVGLLSPVNKWRRFDRAWDGLMGQFGVPYLHMKQINCFPYRAPYDVWGGNENRRGEFLAAVAETMTTHIHRMFTMYVDPSDYRAINEQYNLDGFWQGAYPITALACLVRVDGWKKRQSKYSMHSVRYVFEDGDAGAERFYALSRAMGFRVIPQPKQDPDTGEWFAPFQAADFVAWETAREWAEMTAEERKHPRRKSLNKLLKHFRLETSSFSLNAIRDLCDELPHLFPKRVP